MEYYATTFPEDDSEDDITPNDWMTGVDVGSPGGYLVTGNCETPARAVSVALGQAAWHARHLNKTFRGSIIVYMATDDPDEHSAYEVVIKPT